MPGDAAEACGAELKSHGYERSAIIGTVKPESNQLEPVTLLL